MTPEGEWDPWEGWKDHPDPDAYWSDLDTYPRAPHWRRIETVELPPPSEEET